MCLNTLLSWWASLLVILSMVSLQKNRFEGGFVIAQVLLQCFVVDMLVK